MVRVILRRFPFLYKIARKSHIILNNLLRYRSRKKMGNHYKQVIKSVQSDKTIWFLCIPLHNNLGDYAQYYCIKKLLAESFSDYTVIEIPTAPLAYDYCGIVDVMKKKVKPDDIFIFQSGYTSTDLHDDEIVHRIIASKFKDNKIIFFPQTVKYSSELEAMKTSKIYNSHDHILFMARDNVSFKIAKQYFSNVSVKLMPDIVTTLIGDEIFRRKAQRQRKEIVFCIRHDSEKKYSDSSIRNAFQITDNQANWMDTTLPSGQICTEEVLMSTISKFANYRITVTDRFHGTIFSLISSTPVVVLSTGDHKVVEGAEWFKNVYPDCIKVATDLEDAAKIVKELQEKEIDFSLKTYFKEKYYSSIVNDIKTV